MTQAGLVVSRERGIDAAADVHRQVACLYEQAWNAHTFDFETDIGGFVAPDFTIVSGGALGGRSVLAELSDARAEYVLNSSASVAIELDVTCVADLGATVVVVAEAQLRFAYPDQTSYTEQILLSSTMRLLDDRWVFQHVHCGRGCF